MHDHVITSSLLRGKFFAFFAQQGCALMPSAPLVPLNDPTALFISAGMQPLVPHLLGEPHPAGRRLANVQRCLRTGDIDLVGDAVHLTFFEMLGSWSLGDYSRQEMIPWSWQFLVAEEWLGLDPRRLYITVFGGDDQAGRDEESIDLWQRQFAGAGVDARLGERIVPLGRRDNWWGPVGATGPCGPDTEMFIDSDQPPCSADCRPGCGCGKFVEICNDVFMEYEMLADGTCRPLVQRNVDTGMGVERTLAAINGYGSVFETDIFAPLIARIGALSGLNYGDHIVSFRVLADHVRAAAHLIADGVVPANTDQGYVLRRLIRRAVRHGRGLGLRRDYWLPLIEEVAALHPFLRGKAAAIVERLGDEQVRFEQALGKGLRQFERLVDRRVGRCDGIATIGGEEAFELFATHGIPLEMTREMARERGLRVDGDGFHRALQRHQSSSRQGAAQRFAGGLADDSAQATRYHTATHLLHAALRQVLGPHVEQRGSHINTERLRFDFSHPSAVEAGQLRQVEALVNGAIQRDYPVSWLEMEVEQATGSGAIGLFSERYGDRVKVYSVGDPSAEPRAEPAAATFSREICGGPHVNRTGELGQFHITREQSAGSGVRRVRATLA